MRTNFWAKMLSLVAIAGLVFTSCKDTPVENNGKLEPAVTEVTLTAKGVGTDGKKATISVVTSSTIHVTDDAEWLEASLVGSKMVRLTADENANPAERVAVVTLTNDENLKATIKVTQMGFEANLLLDADYEANPVQIAAEGNVDAPVAITVSTNIPAGFTVAAAEGEMPEWLTAEVNDAFTKIELTAEYSSEFEERTATLVVTPVGEGLASLAKKIVVKQAAQVHAISVEAEGVVEGAVTVEANDAELEFEVSANDVWTLTADADWADVGEGEYTANDDQVVVIFADNDTPATRTVNLTFTCGDATATVAVTQRGAGCFIEVDEQYASMAIGNDAVAVEIPVKTNATNITVSADANWVSGSYDAEAKVVTVNFSANDGQTRETVLKLTGSLAGAENFVLEIPVKQNQFAKDLAVNAEGETETANCYAIYEAGAYKFPATVKGNGEGFYDADGYDLDIAYIPGGTVNIDAANIAKATLLWSTEKSVDPVTNEEKGLISDVSYSGGYVYFTMEEFKVGNAGIAIKDKKGNILWSWHIWATPFNIDAAENTYPVGMTPDGWDEESGEHVTGYAKPSVFMGLNLGATHNGNHGNCSLDELFASFGYLYNWGRKDPFPAGYPNITEVVSSGANAIMYYHDLDVDIPEDLTPQESTEITMYNVTPPYEKINDNIDWAIAHPTIYLKSVGIYGDNCIYSNLPTNYTDGCDENNNSSYWWGYLWGNYTADSNSEGLKSLHDPCPPGWQVPCGNHWHIVTSHSDNIGTWYASYAPWKLNVQEASDAWTKYGGWNQEGPFWPWAHTDEGKWNTSEMINFTRGGDWKGGFNVFTGQSNRTKGEIEPYITAANCPTGAFTPHADGIDEGRPTTPIDEAGTNPMFVPAVGWRMGYNPGINHPGMVCRYHCNQPQNITLEGATWTKHQTMSMSMWTDGTFYRNSAVSWAEWMGNGHPVRCIKPVVLDAEE
ncbi:MAG: BACON domain-containing protein [Rikenellaceae bacterium]|nr:BACON domain-containing protein [Rikenellaceae bacterium]